MGTASDWPGWPTSSPRPDRLEQLVAFLAQGSGDFADFRVYDLPSDPLVELNPQREEVMRRLSPAFGFFAGDGSGGTLGIWLQSSNDAGCPVVHFDSEGQRNVLGENFDDFLRLLAGNWASDQYSELHADDVFRAWVQKIGLTPHARGEERLVQLNLLTLEFQRWFAEEQRRVENQLFPERSFVIDVEPGKRVDVVSIGETEKDVSHRLGTPKFARWEKASDPEMTTWYAGTPYTVVFDRSCRRVKTVRIHADFVVARLPGDFEPLFATQEVALRWLLDRDPNAVEDGNTLTSSALGVSMKLGKGYGYADLPLTWWVTTVEVRKPS